MKCLKIQDGGRLPFFVKCDISASNRLADFNKICMAMHISHFKLSSDHKFENVKIQHCVWWPIGHLKNKKRDISYG